MRLHAWFLVSIFVAVLGQSGNCSGQDILVRLIDARNGRTFSRETVNLQFRVGSGTTTHQEFLNATTGADGVARLRLPATPPAKVTLWPNGLYLCAYDVFPVDTEQVLHDGLVARCSEVPKGCRCKFSQQVLQLQATPGEVVLLVRPVTAWEKFWWRFLE